MLYLEIEFQSRAELKVTQVSSSLSVLRKWTWRRWNDVPNWTEFENWADAGVWVSLLGAMCINFMVWASWHAMSKIWFDCHDNSSISVTGIIPISSSKRHIHCVSGKSNCLGGSLGDQTSVQILFCCTKTVGESLKSLSLSYQKNALLTPPWRISKEQRLHNTTGPWRGSSVD